MEVNAIRAQLERLLASPVFAQSGRMARFLRFTVEQALAGHGDQLKEYRIGLEVFDRSASYDPRIDPIVRVEARRLRAKLRKYYQTQGAGDPVLIEFPKGSYAPVFHERGRPKDSGPPAAARRQSVAVLPFANLSSDPENEYFSDGLTEELIQALTRIEALRVVAWDSAYQFKGKALDIRKIGEQLSVGAML